jgi:hypothetical protein
MVLTDLSFLIIVCLFLSKIRTMNIVEGKQKSMNLVVQQKIK